MRLDSAYTIPAAVFLGIALHDLTSALFLLITKFNTARKTLVWILSTITWLFLALYISIQLLTIDFIDSPFVDGSGNQSSFPHEW